jgi:vacuolar protein sorting-associated protein 13A/C
MAYAWDSPASTNKQLKIRIGERDRLVNVLEIGSQVPFRFKVSSFGLEDV